MEFINERSFLEKLKQSGKITENDEYMIKQYIKRWEVTLFDGVVDTNIMNEREFADAWASFFGYDRFFEDGLFENHFVCFDKISYDMCKKVGIVMIKGKHDSELKYLLCKSPTDKNLVFANEILKDKSVRIGVIEAHSLDLITDRASVSVRDGRC